MKRLLSYLLMTVCLFCVSCEKQDSGWNGPAIVLTLDTGGELETRAGYDGTQDGVDRYNENLISWVDFFFYPGGDTLSDATYHVRRESGKRRSDVMRLEMTSDQINTLIFPSFPKDIRTAKVYAIVNYPSVIVTNESDLSGTSLPALQALEVSSDFVSPSNHRQTQFVMSGTKDITLNGRSQALAASGTIDLRRYACKLTVGVDIAESVTVGNEVWTPMITGMEIYLVNGVSDVNLAGEKTTDPTYFSYRNNALRFAYSDLQDQIHLYFEKSGNFYNTYPTYMYPQHWEYGSTESPNKEPYLKLVVPWVRSADPAHGISGTQKQFYYKIIIPNDHREGYARSFVRNNWYHINIRVGILGSETDEALVNVGGSCYIYDWQDKNVVVKNAEIGNARYLSVDRDTLILRNISDPINIGYTSSHPVAIQELSVTRPYYGTKGVGSTDLGGKIYLDQNGDIYEAGSKYLKYNEDQQRAINNGNDWLNDTGTTIVFQHTLVNDYSNSMFDYSPYRVSFRLRHADRPDDDTFEKNIIVEQYPAVYIQSGKNSDETLHYVGHDRWGNGDRWNKKIYESDYWGYVYVDNEQMVRPDVKESDLSDYYIKYFRDTLLYNHGTNKEDYHWRVVWTTSDATDIFRITTTVLPDNSDFVIGDPRQATVDNLLGEWSSTDPATGWNTADAMEGGQRTLTWYYPAENSDRTRNMMAPSYRIASKCGGIEFDNLTLAQARRRCAAYQEDGFPAGRWRLPTQGEIHFIATLSANNAFSQLFSSGSTYWSANGGVKVNKGNVENVTPNTALLRCVYDSWYWGEDDRLPLGTDPDTGKPYRAHFYWGDRQR